MAENILKGVKNGTHQVIANEIAKNIGKYYKIIESGQKVYIGKDLPGEYTQSVYTRRLNKQIKRVKNQSAQNLGEMIEIATERKWEKNRKLKHSKDAKYGWYNYTTRLAIPKMDSQGNVINFNVYTAKLVIRNDENGKKYLYDIQDIKKENSSRLPAPLIAKVRNIRSNSLNNNISQKDNVVNSSISEKSKNDTDIPQMNTDEETENEIVDRYTEKQYNNFGWIAVNQVLTKNEWSQYNNKLRETLSSKIPRNINGEHVMTVGEHSSDITALVYVKGTAVNPIVTKVVRVNKNISNTENISVILEELADYERQGYREPYSYVESIYEQKIFNVNQRKDFKSLSEVQVERKGNFGVENQKNYRIKRNGAGSTNTNNEIEAGLNKSAFSIGDELEALNEKYGTTVGQSEIDFRVIKSPTITQKEISDMNYLYAIFVSYP